MGLQAVKNIGIRIGTIADEAARSGAKVESISTDLASFINKITSHMPGENSGAYMRPTSEQRKGMLDAWSAIKRGELEEAARLADPHRYNVVKLHDTGTGRDLVMLTERRIKRVKPLGWGTYIWNPQAKLERLATVEVPHPWDDLRTGPLGVQVFSRLESPALLVAGASRKAIPDISDDVAHAADSVFEAIHQSQASQGALMLQLHGFSHKNHPGYPLVVVTEGRKPGATTKKLAGHLENLGWDIGVYDGREKWQNLAARTNVQRKSAQKAGADFVHIEHESRLRHNTGRRIRYGGALSDAVLAALGVSKK